MSNIFDNLLQLPLFQGLSEERLHSLVEKYPFHFLKFNAAERIIDAGDPCSHLRFVVNGSVKVRETSRELRVTVEHCVSAPNVIAPDYLFGLTTNYPFDVYAQEPCGILQLTKGDFLSMLQTDDVLMINILNYLSRNAQRAKHILMGLKEGLTVQRIALLVAALTPQKSAHIALQFRQRDLCHLLGVRRATLLNALNELSGQELITFTTTSITVPHRDALLSVLKAGF